MAFSADVPSLIAVRQAVLVAPADLVRPWALPASNSAAAPCTQPAPSPADPVAPAAPAVAPAWARVRDSAHVLASASAPAWAVRDSLRPLQGKRPAPSVPALPEAAVASNIQR